MNEFLYELLIMLVSVAGAGIVLLVGTLFTVLIVKIIEKSERNKDTE